MKSFGIFASADGVLACVFFILDFSLIHRHTPLFKYSIIPFFTTAIVGIFVWVVIYLNFTDVREFSKRDLAPFFSGIWGNIQSEGNQQALLSVFSGHPAILNS